MRVLGLDHVQLAATPGCEKPASLQARGGVWFRCGSHELHIGVEERFRPAAKAHPAFRVTGYDALQRRLEAAGVEAMDDDAIPGVRRYHRPVGNRLELVADE